MANFTGPVKEMPFIKFFPYKYRIYFQFGLFRKVGNTPDIGWKLHCTDFITKIKPKKMADIKTPGIPVAWHYFKI